MPSPEFDLLLPWEMRFVTLAHRARCFSKWLEDPGEVWPASEARANADHVEREGCEQIGGNRDQSHDVSHEPRRILELRASCHQDREPTPIDEGCHRGRRDAHATHQDRRRVRNVAGCVMPFVRLMSVLLMCSLARVCGGAECFRSSAVGCPSRLTNLQFVASGPLKLTLSWDAAPATDSATSYTVRLHCACFACDALVMHVCSGISGRNDTPLMAGDLLERVVRASSV